MNTTDKISDFDFSELAHEKGRIVKHLKDVVIQINEKKRSPQPLWSWMMIFEEPNKMIIELRRS